MPVTGSRVRALLAALCVFRLLPNGFTNRDLRIHLAPLLGLTPEAMTSGQITYDLRRLRIRLVLPFGRGRRGRLRRRGQLPAARCGLGSVSSARPGIRNRWVSRVRKRACRMPVTVTW